MYGVPVPYSYFVLRTMVRVARVIIDGNHAAAMPMRAMAHDYGEERRGERELNLALPDPDLNLDMP